MQIYRSREVGQSYITSVLTTLIAIAHAFWLMFRMRPQVVIIPYFHFFSHRLHFLLLLEISNSNSSQVITDFILTSGSLQRSWNMHSTLHNCLLLQGWMSFVSSSHSFCFSFDKLL